MDKTIKHFETVSLPDGRTAQLIVPELVKELAVVDLNVIKRMAGMLQTASLSQIKTDFKNRLNECSTLIEYMEALRDELSFHETVNMITVIKPEEVMTEQPVTARVKDY